MTTTAPRPTAVGALRERVIKFAQRVTTPLVPSDYLDLIDPLRSGAALRGRIAAVNAETRDAVTVVIKTGRGWRTHVPGQYVRVGIDVDGVRQWRAYSLTSETSRADGCIAITVKADPGRQRQQPPGPNGRRRHPRPPRPGRRGVHPRLRNHRRRSCSSPPAAASPP